MKRKFSPTILLAFLLLLFCSASHNILALEQLQNRDFSNATYNPPWIPTNPVVQDNALTPFGVNGGNFRVYWEGPGGSANLWDNADGSIYQNFSVTASDTYARIGHRYQIVTNSNGKLWKYSFSANIINNTAPGDSLTPPIITLAGENTNDQTIGFTTPSPTTILVPGKTGNNQYRLEFYWNFGCQKQTDVTGRIDDVSCNLSPSGLTASETADGDVDLDWNDSTSSVVTLSSYNIYRKTSLSDPWGAVYDTSTNSEYTDLTPPNADEVFYAVSDVDNNSVESPLSVYAVYRRAKLEITSVETIPDNVTIGQTVFPVNVNVKNTGFSPARLEEVSLYFQPGVGDYAQTMTSTLPTVLNGGESATVQFSVQVLNTSTPGFDTINAKATGTSLIYDPQVPDDLRVSAATITDSWVIRSPANLAVSKITVPSLVYRDQKDVVVSVTVINDDDKNAAGYLDSLDLRFDHGLYENIRLVDTLPVAVYAEVPVTIDYLVDVNAFSATGTCEINADVYFRDINLLSPSVNFDDAIEPGIWTVVAGVMKTYKGPPLYPSYLIESNSFNVGSTIVYAKTENLLPLTEQRFRWYDPDGIVARVTDPPQTTDGSGVMTDQLSLNAGSKLGTWRVVATRVTNDTPLAEAQFYVVQPAAITIAHQLPTTVTFGQTFTATSTISNSGGADVTDAFADTIEKLAGAGNATLVSGPAPNTATVPGLGNHSFNWQLTADTTGGFTMQGSGYGFDANDSTYLTAATTTSGLCTVQTPPNLSVVSLTENYTNVYLNQKNLLVEMVIRNTGEAAVYVNTASLSFNVGGTQDYDTYSFEVISPALPFVLDDSGDITVQFNVDTALTSANTDSNFNLAASFTAIELNDPTAIHDDVTEATRTNAWYLNDIAGKCAGRADFNPEQYNFSLGQQIWVTFEGMPLPVNYYKVEIYNPSGTQTGYSSGIGAHSVSFSFAAGDPIGKWRAVLTRVNNPGGAGRVELSEQFFTVEAPGQLAAALNIRPLFAELGDNITVTMSLSNTVDGGSEIYPASSSLPLALTSAGYSGAAATLISGPDPASASIKYGSPATFTWVFKTTTETNIGDFFAMNAQATGVDINTQYVSPPSVVTSNSATSNDILILNREMSITPDPLDLGTMVTGAEQDFNLSILNTGNTHFQRITWQKSYPTSADNIKIPYAYFNFFPANGFAIATGTSPTAGYIRFQMPLNQKAGEYTCVMTVFDDLNGNGIYQPGTDDEPYYDFAFRVVASECRVVLAADEIIDLGGYPHGETTSSQTIEILNGGNLNLDKLKFKAGAKTFTNSIVTIIPNTFSTSLATDSYFTASVSADIVAGDALGAHIATYTIWDDIDDDGNIDAGEASDSFQIHFSIGEKNFTVTDLDMGYATPTYTLMDFPITIDNSAGTIGLVNPEAIPMDLVQGGNIIAAEYVTIETPDAAVPAGGTRIATVTVYIPAGTPPGPYTGVQYIYDDENGDDAWAGTVNEKRVGFNLSLEVNPYYAIQTIPSTVDLGGITPGEPPKDVGFLCRNVGNLALDKLTWQETDLTELSDPLQIIDVGKYSISPTPYFNANLGTTFYATVTIQLPLGFTGGYYTGNFGYLYNDDAVASTSDYFTLSCQVGSKKIEFIEAGPLLATGTPNSTSTSASFRVKNTGTLVLAKPRIMAITDLVDSSGPYTIPAAACVFTPSTFDFMASNQIKTGAWSVTVPSGQTVGTYTGTLKVWDDTDNDFIPDTTEASDTIQVELRVIGKVVLTVTSNPADFFYVPANSKAKIDLQLKNSGNLPINEFSELNKYVRIKLFPLNPLSPGPPSIPTTSLEFSPLPLAMTMAVNQTDNLIATITIPAGQTTGPYEGYQIVYYDRDKDGDYDAGSEESVNLLLKVNVNAKSFTVSNPVNMGSGDPSLPGAPSNLNKSFTVTNLSSIPLSKLKWSKVQLVNGSSDILPTSAFSFSPTGPFNVSSGGNKTVSASLTIPLYQAPGTYVAEQTLFEDEDGMNDIDPLDASATFDLQVVVNSRPNLTFTISSLDIGNLNTGDTSAVFDLYFTNGGNEPLNSLVSLPYDLFGPTSTLDSSLISLSIATATAGTLNPGVTALAQLTVGPIPDAQVGETYSGSLCIYDSVKTLASDSITLTVTVVEGTTGLDIASGSIYQEIATLTFHDTTDERYIFSAWVCPGTSTARLAFVESLNDGTVVTTQGVEVDGNGVVTGIGGVLASGLTETSYFDHPDYGKLPWYRVYFAFDYHFDATSADRVHLVLQNLNAPPADKAAVWFDGVQLEKPVIQEKTRPSGFTRQKQLISPSKELDISGDSNYHEW